MCGYVCNILFLSHRYSTEICLIIDINCRNSCSIVFILTFFLKLHFKFNKTEIMISLERIFKLSEQYHSVLKIFNI